MNILLLCIPLIAVELDTNPKIAPVSLEGRIIAHCQTSGVYYDGLEDSGDAVIYFRLNEPLHFQPPKFVYGAIAEVDWLTKQKEWMGGFKAALEDLAQNGQIVIYRLTIETVESEGKRFYQISVLYDV